MQYMPSAEYLTNSSCTSMLILSAKVIECLQINPCFESWTQSFNQSTRHKSQAPCISTQESLGCFHCSSRHQQNAEQLSQAAINVIQHYSINIQNTLIKHLESCNIQKAKQRSLLAWNCFCCRSSETKAPLELYLHAVQGSDDFDKKVFDMEHFQVCFLLNPSLAHSLACSLSRSEGPASCILPDA